MPLRMTSVDLWTTDQGHALSKLEQTSSLTYSSQSTGTYSRNTHPLLRLSNTISTLEIITPLPDLLIGPPFNDRILYEGRWISFCPWELGNCKMWERLCILCSPGTQARWLRFISTTLNAAIISDVYPLPRLDDLLHSTEASSLTTTIDLLSEPGLTAGLKLNGIRHTL